MHHSEHSWVLWAYDKGGKGGIESKATLQRTVYGLDLSLLPMNKYLLPAAGGFGQTDGAGQTGGVGQTGGMGLFVTFLLPLY